jgi:hypothetical protein
METSFKKDTIKNTMLRVDGAPDIHFNGSLIGLAVTEKHDNPNMPWIKLSLYKTEGGKFVCWKVENVRVGTVCQIRYYGGVSSSISGATEYFGYSELAKELYKRAGIPHYIEVD